MGRSILFALAVFWLALSSSTAVTSAKAARIYWTDPMGSNVPAPNVDVIRSANADGTGIQTLVTGLDEPRGIALDPVNRKLYWAEPGSLAIRRTNLNGSGPIESLVPAMDGVSSIALDVQAGKMYWTDAANNHNVNPGLVRRANLDGSAVENVVTAGLRLLR